MKRPIVKIPRQPHAYAMDAAAVITATATLVTAMGGVTAIVITRRTVVKVGDAVTEKLDTVHDLVNSKSERDAKYQEQLIDLLKAKNIEVPVNRGALDNPPSVSSDAP